MSQAGKLHPDNHTSPGNHTVSASKVNAILIADDHDVIRFGLAHLIKEHFCANEIILASDFDESLKRLDNMAIQLAVLDLGMEGMHKTTDLRKIRLKRPDIKLIVLTGSESRQDIIDALTSGVHGYIIKNEPIENLVQRIEKVFSGEIYVPPLIANISPDDDVVTRQAKPERKSGGKAGFLTNRQKDVLRFLTNGAPNKVIAAELGISESAVKMHVAALFRALNVSNRSQVALRGRELLGDDDSLGTEPKE